MATSDNEDRLTPEQLEEIFSRTRVRRRARRICREYFLVEKSKRKSYVFYANKNKLTRQRIYWMFKRIRQEM